MTDVTIISYGASVTGRLKRLRIGQPYPLKADGERVASLEMIVGDPTGLQALLEACGGCDEDHPADGEDSVHRLSYLDGGVDLRIRLGDSVHVIEQLRIWLANPNRMTDVPLDWVRILMIEYELQRAKTAIANREAEQQRESAEAMRKRLEQ